LNNSYEISIPVINTIMNKPEVVEIFKKLRQNVQEYFLNNKIIIKLCDENDIKKVIVRLE
jgi:hypothetical protein